MENEKKSNIIVRLQDFLETKKGQTILNYLYSWGAAIVILGALFKLTHIKGADLMLFIGMGTEVLVFFISGFDRQASTLGGGEADEEKAHGEGAAWSGAPVIVGGAPTVVGAPVVSGTPVTGAPVAAGEGVALDAESIAAMANLAAANAAAAAATAANGPIIIGGATAGEGEGAEGMPTVIGETPTIIGHGGTVDIPEVEKVTNDYVDRLREVSETFSHIAEQAGNLEGSADEIERLSRNLTAINTIYELHLKSLGSQIGNIDNVNEQTQRLADQIEELNSVYKRMLESMTVNMGVRSNANPE